VALWYLSVKGMPSSLKPSWLARTSANVASASRTGIRILPDANCYPRDPRAVGWAAGVSTRLNCGRPCADRELRKAVTHANLAGNTTGHATLWTHVGALTDLGVIGNDLCSYAAAINAGGQVVGGSSSDCNEFWRAFLWEDGGPMVDLNTLIPSGSALYLQVTYAINDGGEIAGIGVDGSRNQHAFLLIPCDQNHPGIAGCDYDPADATATSDVRPARVSHTPAANNGKLSPVAIMSRFHSMMAGRNRNFEPSQQQ